MDKSGYPRRDQRGVELPGQFLCDFPGAGIPGDMGLQQRRIQPQIAELSGDLIGRVVADQNERACTAFVQDFDHGRT